MAKESIASVVDLQSVRNIILDYHQKYNAIADKLNALNVLTGGCTEALIIDKSKEYLHFYIDKKSLAHINEINEMEGCEAVSVFFALENDKNQMTGCFIGVGDDGNILDAHFVDPKSINGSGDPVDNKLGPPYSNKNPNPTSIPESAWLRLDTPFDVVESYFKRKVVEKNEKEL